MGRWRVEKTECVYERSSREETRETHDPHWRALWENPSVSILGVCFGKTLRIERVQVQESLDCPILSALTDALPTFLYFPACECNYFLDNPNLRAKRHLKRGLMYNDPTFPSVLHSFPYPLIRMEGVRRTMELFDIPSSSSTLVVTTGSAD
jgi:hypothetical protein